MAIVDGQLCQEYIRQKLLKSYHLFSSSNRKSGDVFYWDTVYN